MNANELIKKVANSEEPDEALSPALKALWYDGLENWDAAHELVQEPSNQEECLVHAYLHRKEGDEFNAGYWYRKAKRAPAKCSLEHEWRELVSELAGE